MAGSKAATSNSSDDDPEIWRARYWRFRRWQADTHGLSYGTDGAGYRKMQNLLLCRPKNAEQAFKELDAGDRPFRPPVSYVTETVEIAKGIQLARKHPEPKANVYQAAMSLAFSLGEDPFDHNNVSRLFRGEQTTEYSLEKDRFYPSIYRPKAPPFDVSRRCIDIAAHRLRPVAEEHGLSDRDLLSVLQHYDQPTWLLDVTTSPLVALFFASSGGRAGDVGIVYMWSLKEAGKFWKASPGVPPLIRGNRPSLVPRITRQYGAFLEGDEGFVMRDLVFWMTTFRQVDGLVFEDELHGVSERKLRPEDGDEWSGEGLPVRRVAVTPDEAEQHRSKDGDESFLRRLFRKSAENQARRDASAPVLDVMAPTEDSVCGVVAAFAKRSLDHFEWPGDPDPAYLAAAGECLADIYIRVRGSGLRTINSIHTLASAVGDWGLWFREHGHNSEVDIDEAFKSYSYHHMVTLGDDDARWLRNEIESSLRGHGFRPM